jgi:hypothetical protein
MTTPDSVKYVKTVYDNTDGKRHDFKSLAVAVSFANKLSRQGHKVRMVDYKPSKSYIDYLIEDEFEREG